MHSQSSKLRLKIAVLLAPLAVLGVLMAWLNSYGHRDQAQKADAILIFGASVWPGGMASPVLRFRTRHAYNLWKQGLAPKIVCTGGIGKNPPAEAIVEARLLESWGVPESAIVLEEKSTSTRENARFAAKLLPKNASVIAVSDPYHLWRARRDCQKVGLTAFPSPALENWDQVSVWSKLWMTARESIVVARDLIFDLPQIFSR